MKKIKIFLFCTAAVLSFASCKKNDTPAITKTYLTKQTYRDIVHNYYYDAQNRFSRMEYIEPTFSQTTTVTLYDASNNPTEYIVRTSGSTNVSKNNATYDAQNRPLTIERRDSINPTTYTLAHTFSFTYVGNKQIRTGTTAGSANSTVLESIFGADGNFQESNFTNLAGVHTSTTMFSGYDNKNSYEPLLPHILRSGILPSKNNQTTEVFTNNVTGITNNYSATHLYNADNYVIQTTYSGTSTPLVYNYTYEKR
jgi:hypothetical protein